MSQENVHMAKIEYTKLTADLLASMQSKSKPDAPWNNAPAEFWGFLLSSVEMGIPWSVETAQLKASIQSPKPLSKTAQDQLSWALKFNTRAGFEYGIGLEERKYIGGMTGTGYSGEGENRFSPSYDQDPQFVELGKLMTIFWPDLPFLAWEQIKPLVSTRSQESENEYYGATSEYEVDRVDAAKVFRVLRFAERLEPTTHRVPDWKAVISPPPPPAVSPTRKRKS
jgi:hypothetical protein